MSAARKISLPMVLAVLATAASSVQAKGKPQPPPPTPPPPGSCSVAGEEVFPAFAFTSPVYTWKGRNRYFDGYNIYLSNNTGSCSVLVAFADFIMGFSYRQIGSEAVLAWAGASTIKSLRLPVQDGVIVPTLPLSVYANPVSPSSVNDVELSPDGSTIYFTDEHSPEEKHWQDTLKSVDISTCSSDCVPELLYTFPIDVGAGGLSINGTNDRLYLSIHDRVPDLRTLSFLQKGPGGWSSLQHVVSNRDAPYLSVRGFGMTALGRMDSVNTHVLAFVVESASGNTIDILDVSNCGPDTTQTCFGANPAALLRSGISGSWLDFTSTPKTTSSDALLDGIREIDLDSMAAPQFIVEGRAADSAD